MMTGIEIIITITAMKIMATEIMRDMTTGVEMIKDMGMIMEMGIIMITEIMEMDMETIKDTEMIRDIINTTKK